MRLIGIGLLAFFLAGVLIVLARSGAFDSAYYRLTGEDRLTIVDYEQAIADGIDLEGADVFAVPLHRGPPAILSGMPSYQNLTFYLPVDARAASGTLELTYSSQVAEGLEGALRVLVNGEKRADLLLLHGTRTERIDIELTSTELSSGTVNVGLSLQGRGAIAECSVEDSIPAVVAIEPESGLRLTLAQPPASTRDKLALLGGRVPIAWPSDDPVRTLQAAARLYQEGFSPVFGSGGMGGEDLARLVAEARSLDPVYISADYPIPLVTEDINSGARQFDRQTVWRYRYRVADLPGRILPGAVDLQLALGPVAGDREHDVTVLLNNHLLFSRHVEIRSDRLSESIPLPAELQGPRNNIEISINAVAPGEARCGKTSQSVAELLPGTALRSSGQKANDALSSLRDRLREHRRIVLRVGDIGRADAQVAAMLLGRLSPRDIEFVATGRGVTVAVRTGDMTAIGLGLKAREGEWVVHPSADPTAEVVAAPASSIGTINGPAVALQIAFPPERAGSGDEAR